jgi:putative component of toxin-antitoxin plasmid stabilization module
VLVSHRERSLEIRLREGNGWRTTVVREGGVVELSVGARLDVRELYDDAAEPSL